MGPHSWDPGTSPSLVFWTTAVRRDSVKVDLKQERASLRVKNVLVFDSFTLIPNALDPNHPAGHANSIINSLRMDWSGTTRATTFGTPDQEPWSYGTFHEALNRRAIEMRYELLPQIYNVMEEASRTGIPAFRPLLLEYPDDPATWERTSRGGWLRASTT
ncbi:MAG: hypothetical protein DMF82_03960 [Acidobacteria bacterium]|nr:MAG: hypothetical protein DMF82_03960 [Acidobacteriota bacterium]